MLSSRPLGLSEPNVSGTRLIGSCQGWTGRRAGATSRAWKAERSSAWSESTRRRRGIPASRRWRCRAELVRAAHALSKCTRMVHSSPIRSMAPTAPSLAASGVAIGHPWAYGGIGTLVQPIKALGRARPPRTVAYVDLSILPRVCFFSRLVVWPVIAVTYSGQAAGARSGLPARRLRSRSRSERVNFHSNGLADCSQRRSKAASRAATSSRSVKSLGVSTLRWTTEK